MSRRLSHSCWDENDILEMCADAERAELDDYARGFVDDIKAKLDRWGDTMFFSDKQENYLMNVACAGLRAQQKKRGSRV